MKRLFLLALLATSCGPDDSFEVSLRGIEVAPNANSLSIWLHNPNRSCDELRQQTASAQKVFTGVFGTTASLGPNAKSIQIDPITRIHAGFYNVVAVASEGSSPQAFDCASNIQVSDGKATSLTLTLSTL